MEKWCMENRWVWLNTLFTAIFVLFFLPLKTQAQNHLQNEIFLKELINAERSTVLLNNQDLLVPLKEIQDISIASINIGSAYATVFDSILNKYATITSISSADYNNIQSFDDLNEDLKFFNLIIIQVTDQALQDPRTIPLLLDLQRNKSLIVCLSGDIHSLKLLESLNSPLIWTETKSAVSANYLAQLIFGGTGAVSALKHDVSPKYKFGAGYTTRPIRIKYTVPEELGINTNNLKGIDDIAAEAIREKAAPGAVVMVLVDGKVIYNKAYGTHTYTDPAPTRITDIFDLASVTKISATTIAVMRLFEQKRLNLDTIVGAYIPKARSTDKVNISVREVMLHQAGFIPFIPFYRSLSNSDHSRDSSASYPTKVADKYYLRKDYFKSVMWPQMLNSTLANRGKYVYSDLSMYFMKEMVERQSETHLEKYVMDEFYKPLGMKRAGFNPRLRFPKEEIIPTEDDKIFRKTLLEGYVHDQGAAMVGGVSGHAGLFASSNDLAILFQMLLNRGIYGGKQYFKPETVDMFTVRQSSVSRRGLGFDRWDPESVKGYPSRLASEETYGHTGYTGTCVWVDPKYNLVYIFLSNRVNPEVSAKLIELNIRGRIQDVIYEAIRK